MQKKDFSPRVATFMLAAALEKYEVDLRKLVDTWLDLELYRQLQAQWHQLRIYCAALPRLSAAWVAVLVSHGKLLNLLTRNARPAAMELLQEHLAAVDRLHQRCLRMIGARGNLLA